MMNTGLHRGFSLVELLVVMAIIGVMALVSVPLLVQQLPKWHMNGTARDLAGKLMMARLRAIQENEKFGVEFTPGTIDKFKVVKYNDATSAWDGVGVVGEGTSDIDVDLADCITSRIEFNANGSAGTDGTCVDSSSLTAVTVRTLTSGEERKIFLNTYTGNMSVD